MKVKNIMNQLVLSTKVLLVTAALSFVAIGCSDDDDNTPDAPTATILGLAQATNDLSTLEAVLELYPDLKTLLSGSTQYTVFAPTNAAFTEFLAAIGQTSATDVPEEVLRTVLEYHVVSGRVLSTQLTAGNVPTAAGENIAVTVSGGISLNGNTSVTTADILATNGVVHVVNKVLVPPSIRPVVGTIVAPAYFNKNFSTLVAAVVQAELLDDLLAAGDKTLFAPTNAAFAAAGITSIPTDNELLISILTYHVLEGETTASELPATTANTPAAIPTLNGSSFYLTNRGSSSGVFINGSTEVVNTDIQATNGVVHVINRTLVPPTQTIVDIAVAKATSSEPEFTQLVAALSREGVEDLLEAADGGLPNLTVFAPTDAAFEDLYDVLEVEGINDIPLETLIAVLQHHIVGARVFSRDLVSGSVTTLNGNITVNQNLTITDGSGSTTPAALITNSLNIHATNGVIHAIDKVLLP